MLTVTLTITAQTRQPQAPNGELQPWIDQPAETLPNVVVTQREGGSGGPYGTDRTFVYTATLPDGSTRELRSLYQVELKPEGAVICIGAPLPLATRDQPARTERWVLSTPSPAE